MKGQRYRVHKFDADPEVKAHIYQQLAEFEPYLLPESQMAVLVQKMGTKGENGFVVTLVISSEGGKVEGVGNGDNVYDAATQAKKAALLEFEQIQNAVISSGERELEINAIMKNPGTGYIH